MESFEALQQLPMALAPPEPDVLGKLEAPDAAAGGPRPCGPSTGSTAAVQGAARSFAAGHFSGSSSRFVGSHTGPSAGAGSMGGNSALASSLSPAAQGARAGGGSPTRMPRGTDGSHARRRGQSREGAGDQRSRHPANWQEHELGHFASLTKSHVCRLEASQAQMEAKAKASPGGGGGGGGGKPDYPRSLSPGPRMDRAPRAASPQSEEKPGAGDRRPFYDWEQAWHRNAPGTGRGPSMWSRSSSARTSPHQWGGGVQRQQDGCVTGCSDKNSGRAAPSVACSGKAPSQGSPPRTVLSRSPASRSASPVNRAAPGRAGQRAPTLQLSGASRSDGAPPGAEQVLREWRVYKQQTHQPSPGFHLTHPTWQTRTGASFGTAKRPVSRSTAFGTEAFRKPSRSPSPSSGQRQGSSAAGPAHAGQLGASPKV